MKEEDEKDSERKRRRQERREEKRRLLHQAFEMKFSHSIQFNAVPDWSSHYIAYSNLKKIIFNLEKSLNQNQSTSHDAEASPLLQGNLNPDEIFSKALGAELEKICMFYELKEKEIINDVEELLPDAEEYEAEAMVRSTNLDALDGAGAGTRPGKQRGGSFSAFTTGLGRRRRSSNFTGTSGISHTDGIEDSEDEEDEEAALNKPRSMRRTKSAATAPQTSEDFGQGASSATGDMRRSSVAFDDYADQAFHQLFSSGISIKKRTINLYVELCELKSFIQLNQTGFRKVLKKYDKILDRNLKDRYLETEVRKAYPFLPSTLQKLDGYINRMEEIYAHVVTSGDTALAKKELRLHLREHVVWERNTVWREMIGIERKAQAANMGLGRTLLGTDHDPTRARRQGDDDDELLGMKELQTPVGRYRCPAWLCSSTMFTLLFCIIAFLLLLLIPIKGMDVEKPEQQNCLAMLVFVSLLWATEVIPLFVTALLIPFLNVLLRVLVAADGHRLAGKEAASAVFASMWTPVIMLLLGGFTLAAALSKFDIAKRISLFVLSKAGTRPRTVLLCNMFVAAFASMWISNVAAPVLCFSIIQPMLRNLPSGSDMSKSLILGIALASNIGGMLSPIASPQNIVALAIMAPQPSWGIWFFVALPVGIISLLLIWILLLVSFKPGKGTTIVPVRPVKDKFSGTQWFVTIVCLVTIGLWCASHQLEDVFGDMGVVAILPIVVFFGTGILTKEDFNNFLWTIIILAAGGLSLGKAVSSSGLLHTIAGGITGAVEGLGTYAVLVVFSSLILVVATFISHTVAALIILPLVYQVGVAMEEGRPNLLVMAGCLMCSAAMGLPTSGFPNMTAIMMEDSHTGIRYLRVKHFISRGVPASVITLLVVISVGYGCMEIAGL